MVEIRNIQSRERYPEDAYCVIIEFAGGRFAANGHGTEKGRETFWRPSAFDTVDEAIASSIAWASSNSVPIVYVKGIYGRVGVDLVNAGLRAKQPH